jgi:hypothetical protein
MMAVEDVTPSAAIDPCVLWLWCQVLPPNGGRAGEPGLHVSEACRWLSTRTGTNMACKEAMRGYLDAA